jgi:tRNA threonylcarbamoyl adenosine modification protein (Sua5/YciO/YrdC/YwlC family)
MILECLTDGGVIIFPTDTIYGLGGCINQPKTLERICQLKGIRKEKANFSFIFHDLSMLSDFTKPINNDVFKMMKRNLPGPFTFILEANNNIPRIFQSKKKTIGIRIPDQPIITHIVREFGSPIMTTSLLDEEDEISEYLTDPEEIHDRYKDLVDIVIDGGAGDNEASTVVDCTDNDIVIIRQGKGMLDE